MALLCLIVALIFTQGQIRREMETTVREDLRKTWSVFHSYVENRYEFLASQSRVIADDPKFFASIADFDRATAYEVGDHFQEILKSDVFMVTDTAVQLLFEIGDPDKTTIEPSYLPLIEQALQGKTATGLVEKKDGICQAVSVPIWAAGQLVGALTVGYLIDDELAEKIKGNTKSEVIFALGQKIVASTISHELEAKVTKELLLGTGPKPISSQFQTKEGKFHLQKEEYIYLYDYLSESQNQNHIFFVMLRSLDQIITPFMDRIKNVTLTISILGVLFSFILSLFISDNLTSSVKRLVETSRRLAKGNYDTPVQIKSQDEMAELASAFEELRLSLQKNLEELKKANAELLHSERLAAVGNVAAAVVHDFKNPMAVISIALGLLDRKGDDPVVRKGYLEKIKNEIQRVVSMTQDILEFSRGAENITLNLTWWDLSQMLEELTSSLSDSYSESNIKLNFKNTYSGQIRGDRYRLLRVFENLLSNAKEAMTGGGEIWVEVGEQNGEIVTRFKDNGPGIPEEIKQRLFEPFVTYGKPTGTGLGLAISKRIVQEHGGRIEFESTLGRGTTFTIYLSKNILKPAEKYKTDKHLVTA